jgi:hypothetical protein
MDLFHLGMQGIESAVDAHKRLQDAVINWGKLLVAMGGALKPKNCSCYVISFEWKANKTWINNKNEIALGVPMADGSLEQVKHLLINKGINSLQFNDVKWKELDKILKNDLAMKEWFHNCKDKNEVNGARNNIALVLCLVQ